MDFTKIIDTLFVATKYLVTGDPTNLTPEQIEEADKWSEMFEIDSIEEYFESENLGDKISHSLMDEMDSFEEDIG